MPTSFFRVVYLRSSVLAGRCLPAVLTSTCGAIASTVGVDLSIPPVAPADVPALFRPRVGDIYLRWGRDVYLRCLGVYLRSSVLAGRCLPAVLTSTCGAFGCLPPVGQRYLCLTAWGVYLRWFRLHSAGVSLSIPPVAPADVPAIPAQEFGTFTCGATDNYLRC